MRIDTLRTSVSLRGTPGKLVIVLNGMETVTRTLGRPSTVSGALRTVGVGLRPGAEERAASVTLVNADSEAVVGSDAYWAPERAQFSIVIV